MRALAIVALLLLGTAFLTLFIILVTKREDD